MIIFFTRPTFCQHWNTEYMEIWIRKNFVFSGRWVSYIDRIIVIEGVWWFCVIVVIVIVVGGYHYHHYIVATFDIFIPPR